MSGLREWLAGLVDGDDVRLVVQLALLGGLGAASVLAAAAAVGLAWLVFRAVSGL